MMGKTVRIVNYISGSTGVL